MIRKKTFQAVSPDFGWSTDRGSFVARASAVFRNGAPVAVRVYVHRVREADGVRTHFHLWESRELGRSDGNELAEFDAWRMHATGYQPDPWMRKQISFQREDARWKAMHGKAAH